MGPSGSHPSETTVRQTLDGGAGPSGRLPSDYDARPSHRDADAEESEPQLKKQKLAANLPSPNVSRLTFNRPPTNAFFSLMYRTIDEVRVVALFVVAS